MAYDKVLADRVREALETNPVVREVKMFGGLSFMVNDKMVVAVRSDHGLLVRVHPDRVDELRTIDGAQIATMGGRTMHKGWLSVSEEAVATPERLDFWIETAMEYNDSETSEKRPRS
ncbi:MAG: TfoX/Sxy family protein [Nocardia sp.]|nr:TfoX/Sxy family protein [Nocardia sp.]